MRKILTLLFLSFSLLSFSQTEQDSVVFDILNSYRLKIEEKPFEFYPYYADFDYFLDYSLRITDTTETHLKASLESVNNMIDNYYFGVDRVYYVGMISEEQPTPDYLFQVLNLSSNLPNEFSVGTSALTKMILWRVKGKWVSMIYILTF